MNTLFKLENYVILDLFELELDASEGYLRFHGSKNFSQDLIFQNHKFTFIPCELSNLESSSDGRQSKPTLKISNINNYMSYVLKDRNNLIGKNFIRKKVLAKDLDASNFTDGKNPFGFSNFKTFITYDIFVINLKKSENKELIELELATKIDVQNISVPARKVTNDTCSWSYKCYGCNYGNTADYKGPSFEDGLSYLTNDQKTSARNYKNANNNKLHSQWWFQNVWNSVGSVDIGVPIADENNKVFLTNYTSTSSSTSQSYGLNKLNYRARWTETSTYNKGDFVFLEFIPTVPINLREDSFSSFSNSPKLVFVCIQDGILDKRPDLNLDVWKQDQCSKTLSGCRLRFKDYVGIYSEESKNRNGLPFGGFPATFSHENKQ